MKVYLDSDYRCHLTDDGTRRAVETDFFDGKCQVYVEGFRFVPEGETWTREDGIIFNGEMISSINDYTTLIKVQEQYEASNFIRFNELGIPQEKEFIATNNYSINTFISIFNNLYKVISSIPYGASIIIGQNVIKTTIEQYLDTLKEDKK